MARDIYNRMIKSDKYEMIFYEADSFLKVSEYISKKSSVLIFTVNGIEKSIGLTYASHVNHAYAFERTCGITGKLCR